MQMKLLEEETTPSHLPNQILFSTLCSTCLLKPVSHSRHTFQKSIKKRVLEGVTSFKPLPKPILLVAPALPGLLITYPPHLSSFSAGESRRLVWLWLHTVETPINYLPIFLCIISKIQSEGPTHTQMDFLPCSDRHGTDPTDELTKSYCYSRRN